MEILGRVSIDWLGKKFWLLAFSALLLTGGIAGYLTLGGLAYGIDFTGGTIVKVKFAQAPNLDLLREALKSGSTTPPLIQRYDHPAKNTVQVRMQTVIGTEQGMETGRHKLLVMLREAFDPEHVESSRVDFNNAGLDALRKYLLGADPDNLGAQNKTTREIEDYYQNLAQWMLDFRNKDCEGLVASLDDLKKAPGISGAAIASLKKDYYAGPFAIKGHDSVGAVVGLDLRRRATLAVGLSFLGMLVYLGFRFKPIFGIAAVVAVIHDLLITLGLFSITQKEISLTVIAALLTLVGYSVNDTIVVFDRIRENLRIMRKEPFSQVVNLSINQTLSRTIMTSGMTFISVLALFLFGGEVLNGFSFALTVGIIVSTYSSIAIASPMVDWWYRAMDQRSRRRTA